MEGENDKIIKVAGTPDGEAAAPLFSAFRPKPRPAPRPAPAAQPKPAPAEKPSAAAAQESAQKDSAHAPEKEILDYLKTKIGELEGKLRESQEKGLAFAYELKGREEARKESRREMEEFLAAVKQQQSAADSERLHALDLQKSRERIEALEQRLLELSSRPPAPPSAGLTSRLEELTDKINSVSARLDAATKAGGWSPEVSVALGRLEAEILHRANQKIDARMGSEFSALEKSRMELEKAKISFGDFMDSSALALEELLSGRIGEIHKAIHALSTRATAAGLEADKSVEWLRALMDERGRAAAGNIAGAYDLGFIQASLDNLEKCVSSAAEDLAKARADAEADYGLPAITPEMRARRHAAALKSAMDMLMNGLTSFRSLRPEIVKNIKKTLTGEQPPAQY